MQLVIDADALTLGDIEDLENAKQVRQIIPWLVKHAGADAEELRKLPFKQLTSVVKQVQAKFNEALDLPKANGAP